MTGFPQAEKYMKKILGLWSGHDASFCVLNDGKIELHTEAERHIRVKEPPYDSIKLFFEHHGDVSDIIGLSTCHLDNGIKEHKQSWDKISGIAPLYVVGHHQAHASNAFYSSNFKSAIIITLDGGGIEDETGFTTGVTVWKGDDTKLKAVKYIPLSQINIGGVWSRVTRCVFGYESGYPYGNQCGTTMALAALAKNPEKYLKDFRSFMIDNLAKTVARAPGHITGMSVKDPREPRHPFLGKWRDIAQNDEQAKFDMAGALQMATQELILDIVRDAVQELRIGNICISGGVALNSVAMGMLSNMYDVYIPPVPYDAGLTIGSAQHTWHHVLGNQRVDWNKNASSYLGKSYSRKQVLDALESCPQAVVENSDDNFVIELLSNGAIISVFNEKAESGRRALGNRSIIADPRNPQMKDMINQKVKHRQSFRPFAPSILYEHVREWFQVYSDVESPYMNFVLPFKDEVKSKVPAVVHFDGTGRLQTVRKEDNEWYHAFLTKWYQRTGVPILLNTSFNDREPIVEEPIHAINCFMKTQIDYLYFPEHKLLVKKR